MHIIYSWNSRQPELSFTLGTQGNQTWESHWEPLSYWVSTVQCGRGAGISEAWRSLHFMLTSSLKCKRDPNCCLNGWKATSLRNFSFNFFLSIPRVNTRQLQTNQIQGWFLPKWQRNRSRESHQPLFWARTKLHIFCLILVQIYKGCKVLFLGRVFTVWYLNTELLKNDSLATWRG